MLRERERGRERERERGSNGSGLITGGSMGTKLFFLQTIEIKVILINKIE